MALPINAQSIDLRTILQGRNDRQDFEAGQQRNRLTELALEQAPQRMAAEQESQQLQQQRQKLQFSQEQEQAVGTAVGGAAIQMLQPLSNGDFAGAESILDQTSQQLAASGLQLPEGPLRQALRSKNTQALQGILSGAISTARQRGWLKAPEKPAAAPASVQEFEYVQSLSPEQRQLWEQQRQSSNRLSVDPSNVREWQYYQSLSPGEQEQYNALKRGDKLSSTTEKNIISGTEAAQQAEMKFVNYSDLAQRYEQNGGRMSSGVAGRFSEWIKEQTGSQDEFSMLRRDWAAVRASEVVNNLPPGAASDADIAMAMSGFPDDQANPQQIASFLRGVAKMARLNGEYQAFKADFLSTNRSPAGLNQAWREHAAQRGVDRSATTSSGQQPGAAPAAAPAQQPQQPAPGGGVRFLGFE